MADSNHYRVFICHASADSDWVKGFLIAELGLPREQVITPEDFTLGAKKPDEFARALIESDYTLLVITPAFLVAPETADATSVANYQRIINKEKRLIPLLLKPTDLPLQIDFLLRLDCTEVSRQKSQIERLRQTLNAPPPAILPPPLCPYPGMKPFTSQDKYFYGRDNEIDDLLIRVRYQRQIFIIGGSGSGKSSLVFAGLLPKLAAQTDPKWYVRSLRPGDDPPARLAEALGTELPLSVDRLASIVSERLKNQGDKLLLVIDQLEEAFAQSDKEKQAAFYAILNALLPLDNCVTIFTVRADFMGHLINSPLKTDAKSQMQIAPLQNAAMREALVKPAQAVGVWLEDRLVAQMIADAADEPGCMPMLQETMRMLWDRLEHRYLPFETYQALGKGAQRLCRSDGLKRQCGFTRAALQSCRECANARRAHVFALGAVWRWR
ncbi:MAG: toll/interleukin-1 receptor domain-containing protein [Anaerolineae bacterium]